MRVFVFILLAALAISAAPTRAQSNADPGDMFVNAYMSVQQGEKAEQAGNLKQALGKLRSAQTALDQITARFPNWQPQIVDYRRTRTQEGIARVQEKIAKSGPGKGDGGGDGGLPSPDPLNVQPPSGNDKPLNLENPDNMPTAPVSPPPPPTASRNGRHPPAHGGENNDLFAQVEQRVKKLEDDLKSAKDEVAHLQTEKANIAQQLDAAAKSREASEAKQQVLQKRADNAEAALSKAMNDGKGDSEKIKSLQGEAAASKRALREMRIDADADAEIRRQLDDRYKYALSRIALLTEQRDTAKEASSSVPGKIEGIQKQLDQVKKEKDDLATKLQTAETQLGKVTSERDGALAQVAKLQDAQKEIDQLVADKSALMTKLTDAQKTITQFKLEGEEKDRQIASLKTEVGTVREQLAQAKQESANYQRQMADLQAKLEDSGKQLAEAKAENTANAADKKKMLEENGILRGIVLRQQREEAVRAKTRKVVMGELADLEIHSKSLLKQIDFLGQPVVKLSEKERSLFKKPELQVSESEISIGSVEDAAPDKATAPDKTTTPAETAPVPPVAPPQSVPPTPPAPTVTEASAPPVVVPPPAPAPVVENRATPEPVATPKSKSTAANNRKTPKAPEPPKPIDITPLPTQEAAPVLSLNQTIPPVAPISQPSPANTDLASAKPLTNLPSSVPDKAPTPPDSGSATTSSPSGVGAPPESAGGHSGGVPNVPPELLSLAHDGKEQFEKGNYLEAEKIYRKVLAKAPNNLYTLSNLGVVLFRASKFKLAEESFKKAIAVAPEDAFSHCTLGIVFYSQGKYDEAVNELTKALAIDSKNATAHNYLGITASQKGWQEAAQKELETAVALDPNYADAHFNLAVVFATQTPPAKENARKYYQRATELGAERDSALEQLIK